MMERAGNGLLGGGGLWFVKRLLLTMVHLPERSLAVLLEGAAMVASGIDEYLELD